MRFIITCLYTTLLFFFSALSLNAQENWVSGYLIDLNGQKIEGQIDDQDWKAGPYKITFRTGEASEVKNFFPLDVQSFSVAGREYIGARVQVESSRITNKVAEVSEEPVFRIEEVFLETIIKGSRNLYRYQDEMKKEHFAIGEPQYLTMLWNYAKPRGNSTVVVRDVEFRNLLFDYLNNNCPELNEKIKLARYDGNTFDKLFKEWYRCTGESFEEPGKRKLALQFRPTIGIELNRPSITIFEVRPFEVVKSTWETSYTPILGGSLHLLLPVRRQSTRLTLQALYGQLDAQATELSEKVTSTRVTKKTNIQERYLRFYLGMQTDLLGGNRPCFLGGGFSVGFAFDHTVSTRSASRTDPNPDPSFILESITEDRQRNTDSGIFVTFGTRFNRLDLGLRYNYVYQILSRPSLGFAVNQFQFTGSYAL